MRITRTWIMLAAPLLALAPLAAGCGGSSDEKGRSSNRAWRVEIVAAEFPLKQRLGNHVDFMIKVRNVGHDTIPDLAVTVDGFNHRSTETGLADPERPVWVVNNAPPGSKGPDVSTYNLGKLGPGRTVKAVWSLTAVVAGPHAVKYKVAGDLQGRNKTRLPDGSAPEGAFAVTVSDEPKPIGQ